MARLESADLQELVSRPVYPLESTGNEEKQGLGGRNVALLACLCEVDEVGLSPQSQDCFSKSSSAVNTTPLRDDVVPK